MSDHDYRDLLAELDPRQREAVERVIATHSQDRPPTRDNVAAWVAVAKGAAGAADIAARWRR